MLSCFHAPKHFGGLPIHQRRVVRYLCDTETERGIPFHPPIVRYVFGTNMQAGRLVLDLADMHQRTTQSYVRRPYGVGMLVAAYDQTGPHLFQTCPSGNYYEFIAMAIGARSQSAKTYLEKYFEDFEVRLSFIRKGGVEIVKVCSFQ